jgi:hypothetical protein
MCRIRAARKEIHAKIIPSAFGAVDIRIKGKYNKNNRRIK